MPTVKEVADSYHEEEDDAIEYSHSDGVKLNAERDTGMAEKSRRKYDRLKLAGAGLAAGSLGAGGYMGVDDAAEAGGQVLEEFQDYLMTAAANPENLQRAAEASEWTQEVLTSLM